MGPAQQDFGPAGRRGRGLRPPPGLPARLLLDSAQPDAPERDLDGEEIVVGARSVVLTQSLHKEEGLHKETGS